MSKIATVVRSSVSLFAIASAVLTGCGDPEVSKVDVEQTSMKMLTQSVGQPSPPITCPGGLAAKVGAKLTCAMDIDGKTHDVLVDVTSVEGKTANFHIAVSDKPRS